MRKTPVSDAHRSFVLPKPGDTRKSLRLLYERLSDVQAEMQAAQLDAEIMQLGDRICMIVLEDDLLQLIEECEEHFISRIFPSGEQWDSLESRAACVIEELKSYLPSLRNKTSSKSGRPAKVEKSYRLNA